jgi:hypothetical protein
MFNGEEHHVLATVQNSSTRDLWQVQVKPRQVVALTTYVYLKTQALQAMLTDIMAGHIYLEPKLK